MAKPTVIQLGVYIDGTHVNCSKPKHGASVVDDKWKLINQAIDTVKGDKWNEFGISIPFTIYEQLYQSLARFTGRRKEKEGELIIIFHDHRPVAYFNKDHKFWFHVHSCKENRPKEQYRECVSPEHRKGNLPLYFCPACNMDRDKSEFKSYYV